MVTTDPGIPSAPGTCLAPSSLFRPHTDAFLPSMSACPTERSDKTGGPGSGTVTGTATGMKEAVGSREEREAKEAGMVDPDRGAKKEGAATEDMTRISEELPGSPEQGDPFLRVFRVCCG